MDCHFLLQGIFPTQGSNPGLLHCRQTLYPLSHQGSPASGMAHLNGAGKHRDQDLSLQTSLAIQWLRICTPTAEAYLVRDLRSTHATCTCVCVSRLSRVRLCASPWTVALQAPLSTGILQARMLEWVGISSSRGSSPPSNRTQVSRIAGRFFTI